MPSDIARAIKRHPVVTVAVVLVTAYVFGRKHEQQISGYITPLIPVHITKPPSSES